MLAHISQEYIELEETSLEGEQSTPSSPMQGSEWIVSTLADLANYCAFNQLKDVETTLRRALWETSLQLEQSQSQKTHR